ncbi:MAG: DUF21 domain-containing protein [Phycisphaerales bacterium]|nr:DUF21 domain-containing protein [Phycisphaerales bacterium]
MMIPILIGVVALAICGLLAGMETGIYTLNRVRLAARVAKGERSAKRLRVELNHPNRLLATVLVGMNVAHAGLSAATTAVVEKATSDPMQAALLNAAVVLPLVFLVGDAVPKELFRVFTNSWSYGCSGILLFLRTTLAWTGAVPLVRILGDSGARLLGAPRDQNAPTRQRILQSLRDGIESDLIKTVHLEMADRLFGLAERSLGQCLVPWRQVISLPIETTGELSSPVLRGHPFSRIPVVSEEGGRVRVIGVVASLDAILQPKTALCELMQEPLMIDSKTLVMEAARRMRLARQTLAIVTESNSDAPIGIVTLKDLVEPIIGVTPEW